MPRLRLAVTLLRRLALYAWAAPWSLLGLALAVPLWLGGARWQRAAGCGRACGHVEVAGGALARWLGRQPGLRHFAAITFGHVVIAADADALPALRAHEQVHVRQYQRWGPLFGPAYLLAGAWQWLRGRHPYHDNPFEREAYALGGPFAPTQPAPAGAHAGSGAAPAAMPLPAAGPPALAVAQGEIIGAWPHAGRSDSGGTFCGPISPGVSTVSDTQQQIDQLVKNNELVLFMKGSASFPMCGFSGRAIQILKACGVNPQSLVTVNVLEDEAIRQGIKDYSQWPTVPQLYVKGEFIGGSDIMMEMYESGELQQVLGAQG